MKKILFVLLFSSIAIFNLSCDPEALQALLETVSGCTNPLAINHSATAVTDDGSCILAVPGCMDSTSPDSYNANANRACASDGVSQLTDADGEYIGYDAETNTSGSKGECCIANILGCKTVGACNYNADATTDDNSCYFPPAGSSTTCDDLATEGVTTQDDVNTQYAETFSDSNNDGVWSQLSGTYADAAVCNTATGTWYSTYGVCMEAVTNDKNANGKYDGRKGCTDSTKGNYDQYADISCRGGGSSSAWNDCCVASQEGCMIQHASNFVPTANTACGASAGTPNNCCTYDSPGCLDSLAQNYNINATVPCYGCGADGLNYGPNNQILCACCSYVDEHTFDGDAINVCLDSEASNYYFDGPNADPTANLVHMDSHCEYNFQCGYKHFTAEKQAFPLAADGSCDTAGTLPEDAEMGDMTYSSPEIDYYFYEDCSADIEYSLTEKMGNMYHYQWDYHIADTSLNQNNCFGIDTYGGEMWWGAMFHPFEGNWDNDQEYNNAKTECTTHNGMWWDPETSWAFFDAMVEGADQFLPCDQLGQKQDCNERPECHWEMPCDPNDEWCWATEEEGWCQRNDPCHPHNDASACSGVTDFECVWASPEITTFTYPDSTGNQITVTDTMGYYYITSTNDTLNFFDMGCYEFDLCKLIHDEEACNWSDYGCMWDDEAMADQGDGWGGADTTFIDFDQPQCHKEGPGGPGGPGGGEGEDFDPYMAFDWIWDEPDGCIKQGCMAEYTQLKCQNDDGAWYSWEEYNWENGTYDEFGECEFSEAMTSEECWGISDDIIQNWEEEDEGGEGAFEEDEFDIPIPDNIYWNGTECVLEIAWWESMNYEVEIDETTGTGELCFFWDDGMMERISEKKSKAHVVNPNSFHRYTENVLGRLFRNDGCDSYQTEEDCWNVAECEWNYNEQKCMTGWWIGEEGGGPDCPDGFCWDDWDIFYSDCYEIKGYNQDGNEFTLEKVLPRICMDDCGCDIPTGTTEDSCMEGMGFFLRGVCEQYYLMEQDY